MQMTPKHIFWPIVDSSNLYNTGVTRGHGAVLRQIGGRGHFPLRDKDGGQTIRSAISENPLLYANCTALSFIEPELSPIEVLHCENREFNAFFLQKKAVENIEIFRLYRTSDANGAENIFWPIIHSSSLHATCKVTRGQGVVLRRIGGRGHFRSRDNYKMALKPFNPPWPETPCYTQTARLYLL